MSAPSAPQGLQQGAALDPQMHAALLQGNALAAGLAASDLTVERRRSLMRESNQLLQTQKASPTQSQSLAIDLAQRNLPARLYTPQDLRSDLLLVFFHGGGWVAGDLDTHHTSCELLAHYLGCKLLSVQYRKAPEHPFPAPCDDAIDTLAWADAHKSRWGCQRLAVGGDSAGGHLAAVAAHAHHVHSAIKIVGMLLIYPVTAMQFDNRSYRERGQGPGLTADGMRWFWQQFLAPEQAPGSLQPSSDVRAVPLLQAWSTPPVPTVITAAWHDPLYDEAVQYAQHLHAAGAQVSLQSAPDMAHGFLRFTGVCASAHAHVMAAVQAFNATVP